MKHLALAVLWSVAASLAIGQTPAPAAQPTDVASADAIVKALYDVISGPAGQKRDWDRMRSLFVPTAHLTVVSGRPDGSTAHHAFTVEQYIERNGPFLETNGFFEQEVARKTEAYAGITHVFSTYESRKSKDDEKPFARGINSIQLLLDGGRWWIVNVLWFGEDEKNPLPERYVKSGG